MKKNILVITYFAKRSACCPAEWADDKIDSLLKLGNRVILISSLWSEKYVDSNVIHYRVPSLSPKDFKDEVNEILQTRSLPWTTYLWIPSILIIGIPLDIIQYIFTNGLGGGKWSWSISSFISAFLVMFTRKIDFIISTGGPASSHICAVLISKIFKKNLVIELQDPLSGEGIGRNSRSAKLLFEVEKILVKYATKIVYVTKAAAIEAKEKFRNSSTIYSIYPGSKKMVLSKNKSTNEKFTLVHLGTLYSTRNMDTLISAIDILIKQNKINEDDFQIINLGDIYGDFQREYIKKKYIQQLPTLPREKAIAFASNCDISLLIQHNDPRSTTTIPYKTYDYLNVGNPIFGLLNSVELEEMLISKGHFCAPVRDPEKIAEKLFEIYQKRNELKQIKLDGLNIMDQTKELISFN